MPAKRAPAKLSAPTASASSPALNAALVGLASSYALWLLVSRGKVSWPPSDLLANIYTVAGCIALVGPLVLLRREGSETGVGDTLWLTGGLMVWIFNVAAMIRGEGKLASLPTPVASSTMGLVTLAVLVATWRARAGSRTWSWTNVTGWTLGVFWVGLAFATLMPGNPVRLAMR